jgi:hypothetical protein
MTESFLARLGTRTNPRADPFCPGERCWAEPARPFFGAILTDTVLGPVRAIGGRYIAPFRPGEMACWTGPPSLRRSSRESATFAFGSVGQLTTVVARPGTALRVEELAESSPCDAGEPQGPSSQAPRLSFCFRRSGRRGGCGVVPGSDSSFCVERLIFVDLGYESLHAKACENSHYACGCPDRCRSHNRASNTGVAEGQIARSGDYRQSTRDRGNPDFSKEVIN